MFYRMSIYFKDTGTVEFLLMLLSEVPVYCIVQVDETIAVGNSTKSLSLFMTTVDLMCVSHISIFSYLIDWK